MEEERDVPFVITEARRIGKGFWKEMQSYRQTVDELQKENAHLQQTLDNFRHDNRELNRILDKAFDAGFESEWDT